jgi:hypothetical protein
MADIAAEQLRLLKLWKKSKKPIFLDAAKALGPIDVQLIAAVVLARPAHRPREPDGPRLWQMAKLRIIDPKIRVERAAKIVVEPLQLNQNQYEAAVERLRKKYRKQGDSMEYWAGLFVGIESLRDRLQKFAQIAQLTHQGITRVSEVALAISDIAGQAQNWLKNFKSAVGPKSGKKSGGT